MPDIELWPFQNYFRLFESAIIQQRYISAFYDNVVMSLILKFYFNVDLNHRCLTNIEIEKKRELHIIHKTAFYATCCSMNSLSAKQPDLLILILQFFFAAC